MGGGREREKERERGQEGGREQRSACTCVSEHESCLEA